MTDKAKKNTKPLSIKTEKVETLQVDEKGNATMIDFRPLDVLEYIITFVDQQGQSTKEGFMQMQLSGVLREAKKTDSDTIDLLDEEIKYLSEKVEKVRWGPMNNGTTGLIGRIREMAG